MLHLVGCTLRIFIAVLPGMAHSEMHGAIRDIFRTVTITKVTNNICLQFLLQNKFQLFHCQTSYLTPVFIALFDNINNIR